MKDQFSELSEKHKNAYRAFLEMDAREHSEPRKPSAFRHLPWIMIPFSIIALAGIILSASRTVFVFYDIALQQFGQAGVFPTTEAITAFIVIDLFFVVARYVKILLHYQRTHEVQEISKLIWYGFLIAFGVALIANVYSSIKVLPLIQDIRPWLDLIMGIGVGVSVPTLAFISGDILGILWVNAMDKRQHTMDVYLQEMNTFNEARERRWTSKKREFGVSIKENIEAVKVVNSVQANAANKRERVSRQLEMALEWLEANPGHLKTPSRDLVDKIGVSHVTIYKAQQIMLGNGKYTNGTQ